MYYLSRVWIQRTGGDGRRSTIGFDDYKKTDVKVLLKGKRKGLEKLSVVDLYRKVF